MKNKTIKIKKCIMIVALCLSAGLLTGCDADLETVRTYTDNLDNAMQEVIDRNIRVIDELEQSGLLNNQQANIWRQSVREKCLALMDSADKEKYLKNGISENSEEGKKIKAKADAVFDQFIQAISARTGSPKLKEDGSEDPDYPLYNYLGNHWKDIKQDLYQVSPLILFDDTSVTTFLSDLNRPVYVLDTTKKTNGVADATDLKYLQLALAILKNDPDTLQKIMTAENLSDGVTIASVGTIGELKQNMTNLTANQQKALENYVLSFFKKTEYNLASLDKDDVFADSVPNASMTIGETPPPNQLNYDVIISSNGLAAITIRVRELNKNLLPFLQGFSGDVESGSKGLAGNYYLMKSAKIALKLDYKLEVISDIYTGSVDNPGNTMDTNWECKTSPTDFNISIYDGSMATEDGDKNNLINSPFTSRSILVHPKNTVKTKVGYVQRYTTGTSNVEADEVDSNDIDFTKASTKEIISDVEYTCFYKKDGTKVYAHYNWADCPTVVLRDYLEYNYYPNVIGDEQFITVGRFMRVNKLSGTKDDIDKFAESITKNGGSFENPIFISLRNIIDHQSGQGYYEGVSEKLGLGQDNSKAVNEELAKGKDDRKSKLKDTINPGLLDGSGSQDTTQNGAVTEEEQVSKKLQLDAYFNWIRPTEIFGTTEDEDKGIQEINNNDAQGVKDYSIPTLWGMFTSNSISENLWGSWITADSARESGSLAWFSTWLTDNSYTYEITKELLLMSEDSADSTYKQNGGVTIDLAVAAKVQKIQDDKYGFNLERTIRTGSRIVGMLIMLYALTLLGCWVIDINIEGGPGFLKKLTLGKWIAIRDSSGIPPMPPDGTHYLDFKALAFSVFITMCLGVVLMVLDVIDIRDIVMKFTENIFKAVSDMLFS